MMMFDYPKLSRLSNEESVLGITKKNSSFMKSQSLYNVTEVESIYTNSLTCVSAPC